MVNLSGIATARGVAAGPAFIYRGDGDIPIPEYTVQPGGEAAELTRIKRAHELVARDLETLIAVLKERTGREDVRVFECHLMILQDDMLREETARHIADDHLNAEAAVKQTATNARALFARMNDPYFRERVRDLDDIERRLLKALTGFAEEFHFGLKEPSIVVANDLTPSETVLLPKEYVLGFATNGGSATSHVALLARALGIPAVTGLGDITSRVKAGENILLDGTTGAVTLRADAATEAAFREQIDREKSLVIEATSGAPAGTLKEGGDILLYANLHPGVPVDGVKELGARGVGLYRSEYLWLNRELEPTEEEQYQAYSDAARFTATLGPKATLTIRVLDIGGDKLVRGISTKEANPFLGNRSIRYLLSHPEVMKKQLRAILRASVHGRICLLIPMVSCIEELKETTVVIEEVKRELEEQGVLFDREIPLGAMIEVPSAALNADEFAKYVRFFSIGTNDLVQYTMAADRGNDAVSYLYQPFNPAVLKLIRMTLEAAKANGVYVGVCGESAADPVVGTYWAALGVDMLSVSATYIPVLSKVLSRLTRADLDEYAKLPFAMPSGSTAAEIFNACHNWLEEKVPDLAEVLA